MLASYHGHVEASRLLLERGADPELRNDRRQSGVAFKCDVRIATLLLDHGATVDGAGPDGRRRSCLRPCSTGSKSSSCLFSRGTFAEMRDASGATALALALAMGAQRAARRLEGTTAA